MNFEPKLVDHAKYLEIQIYNFRDAFIAENACFLMISVHICTTFSQKKPEVAVNIIYNTLLVKLQKYL